VRWIIAAVILVPIVEALLLWQIGSWIGLGWTLLWLLSAAVAGAVLARREGLRVIGSCRAALQEGRMPEEGVIDGLLIFAGGALLAIPGLLTDLVGIALIAPRTRRIAAERIRAMIARKVEKGLAHVASFATFSIGDPGFDARSDGAPGYPTPGDGDVIDTEGVEVQEALLLGDGKAGPKSDSD